MATSSITKNFILKDKIAYTNFMKMQKEPVINNIPINNRLEEGEELLKQFSFRSNK